MTALVFDVDGTLADTEEAHRSAFNTAFRTNGLNWNWDPERYSHLLGVTGGKERLLSYLDSLVLPAKERQAIAERIPAIHAAKTAVYTTIVERGGLPLRAGIRRLIQEARASGIAVAIASTTTLENVKALVTANLGAEGWLWFDVIAAGDVVRHKKPAPDIYELALKSLNVSPEAAVAIEDSAIGLQAAKSAGLFTVVTPTRWTRGQGFQAADLLLSSLGDPDEPLAPAEARHIGAQYLQLEHLQALHARAEVLS